MRPCPVSVALTDLLGMYQMPAVNCDRTANVYIAGLISVKYPTGVIRMEEILCNVELVKENNDFVVRIQSDLGGVREYKSMNFEEVLDQMVQDLQEEFETF